MIPSLRAAQAITQACAASSLHQAQLAITSPILSKANSKFLLARLKNSHSIDIL